MSAFHLAQMNNARLAAPLSDPSMAGFVDGIALMNDLADRSPGFVWRLTGDTGDGTVVLPADPGTLYTLSVWESVEHLRAFAYQSAHLDYLRRRREWFLPHGTRDALVMWWIPAGRKPTLRAGISRLGRLWAAGPTPEAFTFRQPFPAPEPADPADPDVRSAEQAAEQTVPVGGSVGDPVGVPVGSSGRGGRGGRSGG